MILPGENLIPHQTAVQVSIIQVMKFWVQNAKQKKKCFRE